MYLDIGAIRIQSYLSRTPSLRARRGASALLAVATESSALTAILGGTAEINDEGGEADGTVKLRLQPGIRAEAVEQVAVNVMNHLRRSLPALDLEAAYGSGTDYVVAYHQGIRPQRDAGNVLRSLAPVYEVPITALCDWCQRDSAVGQRLGHDSRYVALCPDCMARNDAGGWRTGTVPAVGLTSEERVHERLQMEYPDLPSAVDDFDQLAGLGWRKSNHVATVYIDGNRIGQFFKELIKSGSPAHKALSCGITECTRDALAIATTTVYRAQRERHELEDGNRPIPALGVLPHLVGGDDVLASVAADYAWLFVCSYLTAFQRTVLALITKAAPELITKDAVKSSVDLPTASASIVFAHSSYPFNRCAAVAADLLKAAKRREAGAASTMLWVDVTRDGERWPGDRRPWMLADLDPGSDSGAVVRQLAALNKSALQSLDKSLADGDDALAKIRAAETARRLGRSDLMTPFVDIADGAARMREALDIARWWS